jgi:hypothetical protein
VRKRALLLVTVLIASTALAGCLPANPIWPDGPYVHPQFITASDSGHNQCMIGLASDYADQIDTWAEYENTDTGNLEFWYGFGSAVAGTSLDEAGCLQSFWATRTVYWSCDRSKFGLTVYNGSQDPDWLRTFRMCNDCTSTGDVVYLGPYPCNTGPVPLIGNVS